METEMNQVDELAKGVLQDPDSTERKTYKKPELIPYENLKEVTGFVGPTNE